MISAQEIGATKTVKEESHVVKSREERAAASAAKGHVDETYKARLQEFVASVPVDVGHEYAKLEAEEINKDIFHEVLTAPEALRRFPMHELSFNGLAVIDLTQSESAGGCGVSPSHLDKIREATIASIQRGLELAKARDLDLDKNAPVGCEILQSRHRIIQDVTKDRATKKAMEDSGLPVAILRLIKANQRGKTVEIDPAYAISSTLASMPVPGDLSTNKRQGFHRDMGEEHSAVFLEKMGRQTYAVLANTTRTSSTFVRAIPGTHVLMQGGVATVNVIELTFGLAIIFNTGLIHSGFGHLDWNYRFHMYLNITRKEKKKYFPPIKDASGIAGSSNTYWVEDQETFNVINGVNLAVAHARSSKGMTKANETIAQKKQKKTKRSMNGVLAMNGKRKRTEEEEKKEEDLLVVEE